MLKKSIKNKGKYSKPSFLIIYCIMSIVPMGYGVSLLSSVVSTW